MAGYPKVYNIEMDPHEDLVVLKVVEDYEATLKAHPNPPAPNITNFQQR